MHRKTAPKAKTGGGVLMNTTHIAVDLAKAVFQIAVSHSPGRVAEDHRLSRARFRSFFLHRPPCHVLMEACGSAHHWGRELGTLGHQVSLLPASHVARYRIGNKTDRSDTRAILEAARNEKITPVPVKSLDQQAITALHRLRSGYLSSRTARINAVRGLLVEFGIPIPKGARTFLPHAHRALDHDLIPAFLRDALLQALEEVKELEAKATGLKDQLQRLGDNIPTVQYLLTVPGIGILSATALFSTVGDIHRFRSGRSLANYLGLTPREASSGLRRRLGRISKRGDTYTRMLLVHGARSALLAAHRATELDQLQAWAIRTAKARGHNIATVALANRIARIAWRVWRDQRPFQRIPQVQEVPA
jgi:transposase